MTDILPIVDKEELQRINNQKVTELEKIASDFKITQRFIPKQLGTITRW